MKKDRNTFFQESQFFNQSGFNAPTPNMMPYQMGSASSNFYVGPNMTPPNYTTGISPNQTQNNYDYSDIESRLSKIERNLNRIDARLNKLESNSIISTDELSDTTNNVYML